MIECARLHEEFGAPLDKKVLRKYPGVGEPLADKILFFNGSASCAWYVASLRPQPGR